MMNPTAQILLHLSLSAEPVPVDPATGCHELIEQRCEALRGEDALRCRIEADAQCDISDAELFIAEGDGKSAESRIDQACRKYEDLLHTMLPDLDPTLLVAATIRYAGAGASIFVLLAREGEVDDLTRAVVRLELSRGFISGLLARREVLDRDSDLRAAFDDLTVRLAAALDQLARRELKLADERYRSVGRTGIGDGGAMNHYRRAASHGAQAYALVRTFAYKATELDARLAQAELHVVLARDDRSEAALACTGYRGLRRDLAAARPLVPDAQKRRYTPILDDFAERAERGARACNAAPRIRAGAALLGVGALGLGVAAGLYAHYVHTCDFGVNPANGNSECLGIPRDGGDTDRYTAQVRASFGLAVVGGAVFATGAALMIPGLVQRKQAKPRRFFLAPNVGTRHASLQLRVNF